MVVELHAKNQLNIRSVKWLGKKIRLQRIHLSAHIYVYKMGKDK